MKLSLSLVAILFLSLPAGAYEAQEVSNGGTIVGVVHWSSGSSATVVPVEQNQDVCGDHIASNNFIEGQHSRLANAVVYLSDIQSGDAPDVQPVTFTHRNCVIEPRAAVAFAGSPIVLRNDDPAPHSFKASVGRTPIFNVAIPLRGQELQRKLPGQDELLSLFSKQRGSKVSASEPLLIRMICEKHRWESAWIFVSPHPYAAVTDVQGRFTIRNVPPGTYHIKVWYEGSRPAGNAEIGRLQFQSEGQVQKVTVETGTTSQVNFDDLQPFASARKPASD